MKLQNKLLIAVLMLIALDGTIITPYILTHVPTAYEANPINAYGYEKLGIKYFYIAMPFMLTSFILTFKWLEYECKSQIKKKKYKLYPVFALLITDIILFSSVIFHNLGILFRW